jgi:hypothetical protein
VHRGRAWSDDDEMEDGRADARGRGGAKRSKGAAVDGMERRRGQAAAYGGSGGTQATR